jgi:hypothetical protein
MVGIISGAAHDKVLFGAEKDDIGSKNSYSCNVKTE